MPGCESQEKEGVQPIMYAIMVRMTELLGVDPPFRTSRHVIREQKTGKVENCPESIIDFVASTMEKYLLTLIPGMLGIPIEVKPITHKNTNADQLLLESRNQVIGHLAKQAMFSLNYRGIGEDSTAFGIELTMGSVTMISLELSNIGTADVKLTSQRSQQMTLFDKATRLHLFTSMATVVGNLSKKQIRKVHLLAFISY